MIEKIQALAKANKQRIVLSEGEDARVVEAGMRAIKDGIADITFVGETTRFAELAKSYDVRAQADHHDPANSEHTEKFADDFYQLRQHKAVTLEDARKAVTSNLTFAAMLVRNDWAQGTIGGAVATTADTVRTALQVIGKAPESNIVSSFFLMYLPLQQRYVAFADCGLVIEPSQQELADIAISTAASYQSLTGEVPKIAMLSFSSLGSANHPLAQSVASSVQIIRAKKPDMLVDGEVQFDAAINPAIAKVKMAGSPLAGDANVFVFPNLSAGNIGYKIAQYVGGATAIGPILQGLAKPANDLSRGCSADDIYQMIALTAVQSL